MEDKQRMMVLAIYIAAAIGLFCWIASSNSEHPVVIRDSSSFEMILLRSQVEMLEMRVHLLEGRNQLWEQKKDDFRFAIDGNAYSNTVNAYALVAQGKEHWFPKPVVAGPNPAEGTEITRFVMP